MADLSVDFWTDKGTSRNDRLQLLEQPLQGLSTLHEMGIMHRDITRQNILRLSLRPPHAAICDYGKAIEVEHSKETRIGPIHTLAPEVWIVEVRGPYTRGIDVWAYGYTIAEILGYSGWAGDQPITPERHEAILAMLQSHVRKFREDEDLVDLAACMLAWDPGQRPTAAEALKHRCWAPIRLSALLEPGPEDGFIVAKGETLKRSRVAPTPAVEFRHRAHDPAAGPLKFSSETENFIC